jgi:hypothetical protein
MTGDPFDDEHEPGAERTSDLSTVSRLMRWRSDVEQQAATQQRGGPFTVSKEAEVTNADQALGQDVDEEPSQELVG